jgi:hypothetical protein
MAPPRIVIVGAGFAGYHAARRLSRLAAGRADIRLINPTDYVLYLPLLPEVLAGAREPEGDEEAGHGDQADEQVGVVERLGDHRVGHHGQDRTG